MSAVRVGSLPAPSWLASISSTASVRVRPGPTVPAALCAGTVLLWGVCAVLGWAGGLRAGWVVLAGCAGVGALALALRGAPFVGLAPLALAGLSWGMATGNQVPASAGDVLGDARLLGWNLGFAASLLLAYVAAVWVDARWHAYRRVRTAVQERRWWGRTPGERERQLGLLEVIPSVRFVMAPDDTCLALAGTRVAVLRSAQWPSGTYEIANTEGVLRNGRPYAPGSDDVSAVAADLTAWSEWLGDTGAQCRGFVVVHPASARARDEVRLDVPAQGRIRVLPAEDLVEDIGGFLAGDPYGVDLVVMRQVDARLGLFTPEGD